MSRQNERRGPLSELELIDRFFRGCGARRADVPLGVGDDAALLDCPPGMRLVAAIDTLVLGTHFLGHFPAQSVGHRALAVNLSDLAAMGARPAWALLALTLPKVDEAWLQGFARGLDAIAREHDVAIVGGDTTSGPLCISVQVLGHVPRDEALLRSGGKPGDVVFVSGTPGDAGGGLALETGKLAVTRAAGAAANVSARATSASEATGSVPADTAPLVNTAGTASAGAASAAEALGNASAASNRAAAAGADAAGILRRRFFFPTPRVDLGMRLRPFARACIDVSDGLLGDAGKLAKASGCGVRLNWEQLPISDALRDVAGETRARELALTGGDDYELCFAVARENIDRMTRELPPDEWSYHAIGELVAEPGAVVARGGIVMDFSHSGFDHFGG